MKRNLILGLMLLISMSLLAFEPHFAKDPDISPDGKEICFVYQGDLWKVPFEGGRAIRLTDTDADNSNPTYSPDGKQIAFDTNRDGYRGIYVISSEGGEIRQISEAGYSLQSWFPDGKALLAGKYEMRFGSGFSKISLDGKRAVEITLIGGPFSAISSDGNTIVYSDRGDPYREAYTGSTNGELWKYDIKKQKHEKLTNSDVSERYAEFSRVNPNRLYYAKSDGAVFQLFRTDNFDFKNEEQLTNFPTWSVRDISIARNSDKLVFEKFDEIWSYDEGSKSKEKAKKVDIDIREVLENNSLVRKYVVNGFEDFEVSRNDEFMVFNYEYDLFMVPVAGGQVKQITNNQIPFQGIRILRDNKTVIATGRERGEGQIYKFSIDNPTNIELLSWSKDKAISEISETPKGNFIIQYYMEKNQQKTALTDSLFATFKPITFNKYEITDYADRDNSRYIAYIEYDIEKNVAYIYLRDTIINESYLLYNSYKSCYNLVWGKDDKSLFFTEGGDVKRIDLHPTDNLAKYSDPWEKIITKEAKADAKADAKKSEPKEEYPELIFEVKGLQNRIKSVITSPGYNTIISVINDSTLYYANSGKSTTIYQANYDGKNPDKLTIIEDRDYYSYNEDSYTYYYNNGMNIKSFNLKSRSSEEISNSFFYEYDLNKVRKQVFKEVWGQFGLNFYDSNMHGIDWEKIYKKYEPYTQYCYNEDALSNIIDEMIGEVNASHTGFSPKNDERSFYYKLGYLGAELDYSERLKKGIKFRRLYDGTSLKDYYKLKPGDLLLEVNGQPIIETTDLTKLFFNTQNQKIKLKVQKHKEDPFEIWVETLNGMQSYNLEYQDWVNRRKEIVAEKSNNKLAYLHIKGMDMSSYTKFLEEFWNDNIKKDGFIIDVRGNGGGNISEELIDAISKKPISISSYRGWGDKKFKTPSRYYDKQIVILIDEDSFSDAEVFPHLIKEQKLGTIIGMPTSGSVIGTFDIDLFDGSSLRLPRSGWWTLSGTNMEGNGVQPDIKVELTPEDRLLDNDRQLDKAIEYLLKN